MSELTEQFSELSLSPPLIPSLPNDVTLDIVARVPRSHYPTLSLVSKSFRKLIASSKLYKRRSQLGITQHRLFTVLCNCNTGDFSVYTLHKKLNCTNRLVHVRSLPPMSPRGSYVPVGSKVYAFNDLSALTFDCTSHTVHPISDIPQRMSYKVVNVVDMDGKKKIYVIGDSFCHVIEEGGGWWKGWRKAVTVFDAETQSWEPKVVKEDMAIGLGPFWSDSVVMDGKVYLKGCNSKRDSFVYGPEEKKWEVMDEVMNSKDWEGACVVDDVIYYYDCSEEVLRAFDPKERCGWRVVNGLGESLVAQTAKSKWCDAVSYGGKKLALLFPKKRDDDDSEVICCAEIGLERRQGGEIWGKMESCNVVVEDGLSELVKCVAVTV